MAKPTTWAELLNTIAQQQQNTGGENYNASGANYVVPGYENLGQMAAHYGNNNQIDSLQGVDLKDPRNRGFKGGETGIWGTQLIPGANGGIDTHDSQATNKLSPIDYLPYLMMAAAGGGIGAAGAAGEGAGAATGAFADGLEMGAAGGSIAGGGTAAFNAELAAMGGAGAAGGGAGSGIIQGGSTPTWLGGADLPAVSGGGGNFGLGSGLSGTGTGLGETSIAGLNAGNLLGQAGGAGMAGGVGSGLSGVGLADAATTAAGSGGGMISSIGNSLSNGLSNLKTSDILQGVGTIAGAIGANKAAGAQQDAANAATAEQRRQYDLSRQDALAQQAKTDANNKPWLTAGTGAINALGAGVQPGGQFTKNFTMADYQADPGYQFRLQQGEQGINRAAAAGGGRLSGATLKALNRFDQDSASQEYGNAYSRFNNDQTNQYNRLAGVAGSGQTASYLLANSGNATQNNLSSLGQNTTNNINNNMMGAGNARASGYVGMTNALNNGISQYYNNQQNQDFVQTLRDRNKLGF